MLKPTTTNNRQPTTTDNQQQQTTNNNQQQTTNNNQQPTTDNQQQPTTNNRQPTTDNRQPTTTNNQQQTTNNRQQTNDQQPTTTPMPFKFKEFTIKQDRCAMKIGTDGVLLGAWASLDHEPFNILDIGAGTGIIALQMAQRADAEIIDALEIDDNAYEQCVENFENSPWADRLFCYHASLEEFVDEMTSEESSFEDDTADEEKYDLIISNPPFYSEDYKSPTKSRDAARFNDAMPFEDLLKSASLLLSEEGIFTVIIPRKEEEKFIEIAANFHLFPKRICRVRGSKTVAEKRSMMEFSFEITSPIIEQLTIENARHDYTEEYISLVKDFYLKM